jgi:hypothetical protein
MRATRTTLLAIAVPAIAYLVLLVLVAALWVKPPLLGWIGLAVVVALTAAGTAAAFVLFPRMRRNVDAVAGVERRRLLVLVDTTCPALEIRDSIVAALAGPEPEVLVVAPVLASPLHYLADDERAERADAEARLEALGDALAEFPAVEALVVTSTETHWLERDLFERARQLVPVLQHVQTAERAPL